ncbi:peptidoglycan-binding domain-containing protein [Streptomyces sp. NPDC050264]|uniref:peptidoglycan-binding domain-containing protein n=1 Tax=Streptomyces sp. NPDC050264 TaxID=3155038 RepID=UPI0034380BA1
MEGFSPLRVRPYVTLPEPSQPPPPRVPDPYAHPPLPPEQPPAVTESDDTGHDHPADRTRRTPVLLLAAVAGVLSVAALVTVLISSGDGDTPATAQEAAAPLPTTSAPHDPAPTPSVSVRPTTPPPSSAPASRPASAAASPTPTPGRTPSPTPSASAPSATATATRQIRPPRGTALRRGDRGPEVAELQRRLGQLNLYRGRPDGRYDSRTEYAVGAFQMARGVHGDTPGTYGPATRRALESETR